MNPCSSRHSANVLCVSVECQGPRQTGETGMGSNVKTTGQGPSCREVTAWKAGVFI